MNNVRATGSGASGLCCSSSQLTSANSTVVFQGGGKKNLLPNKRGSFVLCVLGSFFAVPCYILCFPSFCWTSHFPPLSFINSWVASSASFSQLWRFSRWLHILTQYLQQKDSPPSAPTPSHPPCTSTHTHYFVFNKGVVTTFSLAGWMTININLTFTLLIEM